jgi:O-antigen/teichoic acid export membrane protein
VRRAALRSTAATFVAAIPLLALGGLALGLVYGERFAVGTSAFRILTVEAVLSGAVMVLIPGFTAMGKPGTASLAEIVGLVAMVLLLLALVPRYGLVGAALALLLSTTARIAFVALQARAGLAARSVAVGTASD